MKPVQYSHIPDQPDEPALQVDEATPETLDKPRLSNKLKLTFVSAYILLFGVALICGIILLIEPSTKLSLLTRYNLALHIYADSIEANGTSQAVWINRAEQEYECNIEYGIEYPYCGLVIKFKKDLQMNVQPDDGYTFAEANPIDLSSYSKIVLDMEYEGPSQALNVFLRNGAVPSTFAQYERVPYFNGLFNPHHSTPEIKLNKLRPVSWWVDRFTPTEDLLDKPFNQVLELGIDLPAKPAEGPHKFKINDIKAFKPIFSPALVLYTGLGALICAVIAAGGQVLAGRMSSRYREENQTLRSKINEDPLTHCLNRLGLENIVNHMFPLSFGVKVYVLVLDLDHFKHINDTYGHAVGDKVLKTTAQTLSQQLRKEDVLGRWGGEEFVLITRVVGADRVNGLVERLMGAIRQLHFGEGANAFSISMSVGVTEVRKGEAFGSAFNRADKAMYDAKNAGRDTYKIL